MLNFCCIHQQIYDTYCVYCGPPVKPESLVRASPQKTVIKCPPPALRSLVSCTDNVQEYVGVGARCASNINQILRKNGYLCDTFGNVLDFACGCGRVLNFIQIYADPQSLHGCDYDPRLVAWCEQHLSIGGGFVVNPGEPPTSYPDGY